MVKVWRPNHEAGEEGDVIVSQKASAVVPVPGHTKFFDLETCSLAIAHAQFRAGHRGPIAQKDHQWKCNHIACPSCGLLPILRWTARHRLKGAVIASPTVDFILTWCPLDIHSHSVPALCRFLATVESLRDALCCGLLGPIDGFLGAVEYNPPPLGGSGKFQPHVHVSVLPGRLSLVPMLKAFRKFWLDGGGKALKCRVPDTNGLSGAIAYLNKHPLKPFDDAQRLKLHHCVLGPVERARKAPAAPRFVGGRALSRHGFRMMRAKARFLRFKPKMTLSHAAENPDRKAERYCPTVQQVCPIEACPHCQAFGNRIKRNGSTRAGKKRWRCNKCGKSWIERPILDASNRASEMKREDAMIRRWRRKLGSIAAVSRILHFSKARVRKATRSCRGSNSSTGHTT